MDMPDTYSAARLSNAESDAAKRRRVAAEASLACERMYLTPAEKALFDRFERERLSHEECRRQIIEFCRHHQLPAHAAE
jgi:hypothetical protein